MAKAALRSQRRSKGRGPASYRPLYPDSAVDASDSTLQPDPLLQSIPPNTVVPVTGFLSKHTLFKSQPHFLTGPCSSLAVFSIALCQGNVLMYGRYLKSRHHQSSFSSSFLLGPCPPQKFPLRGRTVRENLYLQLGRIFRGPP
jgi:hypothetical protein